MHELVKKPAQCQRLVALYLPPQKKNVEKIPNKFLVCGVRDSSSNDACKISLVATIT